MTMIAFEDWKPHRKTAALIETVNGVIDEYRRDGYRLTLRQLYYQLVARDLIPNRQAEYDKLGVTLVKARKAGLVSWDAIEDRTRNLSRFYSEDDPVDALQRTLDSYREDHWKTQPFKVEVWIEKEALANVVERACQATGTPWLCCRGYMSVSEKFEAGHYRFGDGRNVVLYLGDHDPSGIDMPRELQASLEMFSGTDGNVLKVIALTREQVAEHDPPPNPAKETDRRHAAYVDLHGHDCWELDALEPSVLVGLIEWHIGDWIDDDLWAESEATEAENKGRLQNAIAAFAL